MHIIICVGDCDAVLFGGKRVSRDKEIDKKINALLNGNRVYCSPSSRAILIETPTTLGRLEDTENGSYYFLEDSIPPDIVNKIETLTVFRYNRKYPYDTTLGLDTSNYKKVHSEEFKGYSHEKITMDIYQLS